MSWEPGALIPPDKAVRPAPPRVCGFLYDGRRHAFSGEPESAKSMLSLIVALEYLRATPQDRLNLSDVALIDFEGNRDTISNMLAELGATAAEVERFSYFQPTGPPTDQDVYDITQELNCGLVIIDSSIGAYAASSLDDERRTQVEKFATQWVTPFWEYGAATLLLDHVTKSTEGRGRWMIGSERKLGQADVALGVDSITPISRGTTGLYKIIAGKDRGGYLKRGHIVTELHLTSDPETHRIGWEFRQPSATMEDSTWRPTVLMERVSDYLALHPEASRNEIEQNVKGKSTDHKRQAIDELVALGNVTETKGSRGARLYTLQTPFLASPDLAATSPGEVDSRPRLLARPLQGGEAIGEVNGEDNNRTSPGEVNGNGHVNLTVDPDDGPDQNEIERLADLARKWTA